MKKIINPLLAMALATILSLSAKAQTNLVPNWSFEVYDTCPDNQSQIHFCSDWSAFRNFGEYYNACCTNGIAGVPDNLAGSMEAASGRAYAGIEIDPPLQLNGFRDYIGAKLISPLTIGIKYYVSFKASPALFRSTFTTTAQDVCNKLGTFFTTVSYNYNNQMPIPNYSQVYTDSIVGDTGVWNTVRGSFIADSAYKYVVVGNFFYDSLVTYLDINPSGDYHAAYYYIDNVCVSTDSMYCETLSAIPEIDLSADINVFPNPCANHLTVDMKNVPSSMVCVGIYDIEGRMILEQKLQINNHSLIDVHTLNPGVYLLSLIINNESKKIVFIKN